MDFRMIPLGDIDLQREILLDTGAVDRRRERPRVRRVYTAKIEGRKSDVTVAMYQGEGAQEVCSIIPLVYIRPLTFPGMEGGHKTLLVASVREQLSSSVINLLFQSSKYRSTLLFRKFLDDACCGAQ